MTEKFFNSKIPIIAALMNQVSDLNLALSVFDAGGFPSLFWYNLDSLELEINKFKEYTGNTNVIVQMSKSTLCDVSFLEQVRNLKISHCELLPVENGTPVPLDKILSDRTVIKSLEYLKQTTKIIARAGHNGPITINHDLIDALALKGIESAGITGNWSVPDLFLAQKEQTPSIKLIPLGGVSSPAQVKWYLDHGAEAVAVGTLFAASKESPLSIEAKNKMVSSNKLDIQKLPDTNQNCLVYDNTNSIDTTVDEDWNRSDLLKNAVQNLPGDKVLYAGHGITSIDRIKSVKEIVDFLSSSIVN